MKKPKAVSRYADHLIYGHGEVLEVRALDGGALVADVHFDDDSQRTIRLSAQYWNSDISSLTPKPEKARKSRKAIEPEMEAA